MIFHLIHDFLQCHNNRVLIPVYENSEIILCSFRAWRAALSLLILWSMHGNLNMTNCSQCKIIRKHNAHAQNANMTNQQLFFHIFRICDAETRQAKGLEALQCFEQFVIPVTCQKGVHFNFSKRSLDMLCFKQVIESIAVNQA